jgi:hypothetical protein
MKKQMYLLNTLLAVILGILLLAAVLVRTFVPIVILPKPDITNLVLVSLAALLADHYLAPNASRCYICIPLLSALTFGLLPWAACFVDVVQALTLAVVGGAVFTATTWLFTSILERISSGPARKAAPLVSAFGLYLAAQGFLGLFLY